MVAVTDSRRSPVITHRDIYLVVHKVSYGYVKDVCAYILSTLTELCAVRPTLLLLTDVADVNYHPNSVVFVIGDPFPRFSKRPDCFYVFVNFSLLYRVTGRWLMFGATRWIRAKRQAFMAKLSCYDMVIDFYAPHSELLRHEIEEATGVRVLPFLTNVKLDANISTRPLDQCEWDVCAVGSISPRRALIYERLSRLGYRVSPLTGDLGTVVANSKLTINVHAFSCDTLEAPRIIQVLQMGKCLVTENCHGLESIVPPPYYCADKYSRLVDRVRGLLANPHHIEAIGRTAYVYMHQTYDPRCQLSWKHIIEAVTV